MSVDKEWVRDLLVFRFAGALRRQDVTMETIKNAKKWIDDGRHFLTPEAVSILSQHCVRLLGPPAARSPTCKASDLDSIVEDVYQSGFFSPQDEVEFLCQIADAAKFRGFNVDISARIESLMRSTEVGDGERQFLRAALIGLK